MVGFAGRDERATTDSHIQMCVQSVLVTAPMIKGTDT